MSRKKKILIWILCLSPFYGFLILMYIVKINTISESIPSDGERTEGIIYFSDLENPKNNLSPIIYSSDGKILGEYYKSIACKL